MTTLYNLKTTIRENIGASSTDRDAIIKTSINHALKIITRLVEFPELERSSTSSLTIGVYEYQLSELGINSAALKGIYKIILRDQNGKFYPPLAQISTNMFDEIVLPTINSTTGRPGKWARFGNSILFDQRPNQAYGCLVRYHIFHPNLENDDDELLIPVDEEVTSLATSLCWMALEEPEQALYWWKIAESVMRSIGVDLRHEFNFNKPITLNKQTKRGSEYWKDPFVKKGG